MRKVGSLLCILIAIAAVIFAFFAKNASGWFVGLALFRVVGDGSFMGMIGNIFGVLITLGGFAVTGFFGLSKNDKKALISSAAMLGLCILSLIITICTGVFTIGDILIMIPPALILIALLKH